jgi:hypothetical protein
VKGYSPDDQLPAAERRAFLIYYARVMLREARARRGQRVAWMIAGAAKARREALAIDVRPAQMSLL